MMRLPRALTYRIDALPAKTPVLEFMQRECGLDDHEAYGTLNMGAGFALYLAAQLCITLGILRTAVPRPVGQAART